MKVNEIFGPTIQGEGKSAGKEVLFLRLSTCNLHCIWCDTPYTWNWTGTKHSHPKKFDYKSEVWEMDNVHIYHKLEELGKGRVKALVISGGEPLLQQINLLPLLEVLHLKGWWIEIETNGTIAPLPDVLKFVNQINCSPKLSNSMDEKKFRVRPTALNVLSASEKVYFKFVVSSENDVPEIQEYVQTYRMVPSRVYLMPLGMTRDELLLTREKTKALAETHGYNFSDRLHVIKFGGIRAV